MLRLGADDFVPYPLPEGALHEAIERLRKPAPGMPDGPPRNRSLNTTPASRPRATATA
jgi:pilus assembly protein CpaE